MISHILGHGWANLPVRRAWPALTALALLLSFVGPAHSQSNDQAAASPDERLDAAIAQLTTEARVLDQPDNEEVEPVFTRPHPAVADWPADMLEPTLRRMQDRFTGDPFRDTYIRWHLIWTVRRALSEALNDQSTHDLPDTVTDQAIALISDMPAELRREHLPERQRQPEDLWQEYNELRRTTRITVGYPPFDQVYEGEEALPHVAPDRRAEVQAAVARMNQLRPRIQTIVDRDAIRMNNRADELNRIVRQYCGELIYVLVQTGDERALRRVGSEINRQLRFAQQWITFDLMRYLYLAMFDGYLSLYEPAAYQQLASTIRSAAERTDNYRVYRFGGQTMPGAPRERNFAEYAFHMVNLLEQPDTLRWFEPHGDNDDGTDFAQSDDLPRGRGDDFQFTPFNFTTRDVQAARQRAVAAIYNSGALADRIEPIYELDRSRRREMSDTNRQRDPEEFQQLLNEFGNQALIGWALMAGGESFQHPRLLRRINWALTSDTPYTFDRGLRMQMLAQMPRDRWQPWMQRDLRWLLNAMSDKGNWTESYTGGQSTAWGDHANGVYGLLGMWGAQQAGFEIPLATWQLIDTHWRTTQQTTAEDQPAGWAVNMFNVQQPDTDDATSQFNTQVSGSMTATGVAALTLTERYLYGPERSNPDEQNVSTHLQKGIDWLDNNFTLSTENTSDNWFYYMWTMQRVGQATGYRTFNGIDWFRDITAEILNRQRPDGLWEDPNQQMSPLVATGFALLYLGNSRAPIAVSKVRFDGEWNNRPHDLWNFVDYASDQYEVESSWQIVEPDQPTYQLIESPVLFMATDEHFMLSEAQIEGLRNYIHAGGLLVLNPDQADAGAARGFNELTTALFPDLEMQDVPDDHAFYRIHETLRPSVRMRMMHNGVRPLVVQFVRDIGEGLQTNQIGRSGSFTALNNIYLHSVSLNPRRSRMERHHVPVELIEASRPAHAVDAVRLTHGGTYDPEPMALPQMQAMLARDHDIALQVETLDPTALSDQPLAFLTTMGDAALTDAQAQAIRDWLERGGTLWLDAAGGSREATENARALLEQIAPDTTPVRFPSDSPIITGRGLKNGFDNRRIEFRYYALREMGPVTRPRLQTVRIADRPAIIYSPEDLTTGMAGIEQWGLFGYSVESARQLVINSVLDAMER